MRPHLLRGQLAGPDHFHRGWPRHPELAGSHRGRQLLGERADCDATAARARTFTTVAKDVGELSRQPCRPLLVTNSQRASDMHYLRPEVTNKHVAVMAGVTHFAAASLDG
jgi:hypothetical protein